MLQSQLLQPLLLQLLESCPELTDILPLSASLISLDLQKPFLSCVSKLAVEQDVWRVNKDTRLPNEYSNDGVRFVANTETTALLKSTEHNNVTFGSTNRNSVGGQEVDPHDSQNEQDSGRSRIEELQREIDNLDENYDSDYINVNVNPIDDLNITSLMVARDWNQRTANEVWKVYMFGKYRLYMYSVNEKYALLLCTTLNYPSMIAISRLKCVCEKLSKKI